MKKKIVLVEDDRILSTTLGEELRDAGFEVAKAFDGEEALKVILEQLPDLVLLDLILPKLDGMSVFLKLQENQATSHIPVIVLTNLSDNAKVSEALQAGVFEYLVKSDWNMSDVAERVKEKLGA